MEGTRRVGGKVKVNVRVGEGVAGVWRMENAGILVQIILTSRVPALPSYKLIFFFCNISCIL